MMTFDKDFDLYETALLEDDELLELFITECEQELLAAPADFANSVMRGINNKTVTTVTIVPVLSRKLCAAVCFCSAAAIMLFTVFGFDRQISDFILNSSGRLNELFDAIKSLTIGGQL
jgi:hypothetical protein